jgi:hypothetical protein
MYGIHGNLFNDATATDMADQNISTMIYDELESRASSSPGQLMQNSRYVVKRWAAINSNTN